MPHRLKTRCRFPGCPELVRGQRFCTDHRACASQQQDARRGTPAERGYDHDWGRVAAVRRQLDHALCQPCLSRQRLQPARTVDHIVPLHVRPDWRLELENTQVICNDCHRRKTLADSQRYGSSTARNLTAAQRNERQLAQGLRDPPRAGSDE